MQIEQTYRIGMLWAAFVADSLSLGGHWIYDPKKISQEIKDFNQYNDPISIFHPTKKAGDFTHCGDFMIFLIHRIQGDQLTQSTFYKAWVSFMSSYNGYIDNASRIALENIYNGQIPSGQVDIADLVPATRIAPLVYALTNDKLNNTANLQTIMTHQHTLCSLTTRYVLHIIQQILSGISPKEAITASLEQPNFAELYTFINQALECTLDDNEAIANFSPACDINGGLQGALMLISRYENDLANALIQNVKAGGDSAARGLLIGMALGAYKGIEAIPKPWIKGLNAYNTINDFVEKFA